MPESFKISVNAYGNSSINASSNQAAGPNDPRELEAFMDGLVEAQLKSYHIPGATASVVKDGRIIFAKGYGYSDIALCRPVVANETLFRVGSVSKLFVWTSAMQLEEQGRLNLSSDINSYLKSFQIPDTYPQPITMINLMSHTPGFEDIMHGIFIRNASDLTPLGGYLSKNMPSRVRPPGQVSAYSNYGASLAGYIVGEISSRPFDQYVDENIFRPLQMKNSTFKQPLPDRLSGQMATGYTYSGGDYQSEPFEYLETWPAGSMSSTSEDMAKFMIAHLQNGRYGDARILQDATARRMHSLLFASDPRVSGWDYGFMQLSMNNQRIIEHGGDTIQFHTMLALLPEHDLGLFVSYNSAGGAVARTELLQAFLDRYYAVPVPKPISGQKDQSSNLTGSYLSSRRSYTTYDKIAALFLEIQVAADQGGHLTTTQAIINSDKWVEFSPLAYRKADIQAPYDGLIFHTDAGRIDRFYKINDPTEAFEKAAWYDSQYFNLGLLAICIILFISAIISWPLGLITSRGRYGGSHGSALRYAHWLAGTASALDLIFIMGLAATIAISPMEFVYGVPRSLTVLLSLAILASILGVTSAVMAALIWWHGSYSLKSRTYYSLVVLADLAFIWWLNNWNLLGYRY